MFIFRFFFIGFILFLILNPKYKSEIRIIEKPIVIIAKDNSESIKNDITQKLKLLGKSLDEFEVYFFSFSDDTYNDIDKKFDGFQTNYSKFFSSIKTQFENRNIVALVLASDGCYNTGLNPEYISYDFPVFSIALGDTSFYEDIRIDNVIYNEVAFLDNKFPVEISLASNLLQKKYSRLIIEINEDIIYEKIINFSKGKDYQTHNIYLPANELGVQSYSIKIEALNQEKNILNNKYKLYIDILDTKHKILILNKNITPDIAAFKSALSSVDNYSIDINDSTQLNKYSLIVLFGYEKIPNNILNSQIPLIIFDVKQYHFNQLKSGISFNSSEYVDLVNTHYNVNFTKFSISKKLIELINTAPPLFVNMGSYKFSEKSDFFLNQEVDNFKTNKPIICFEEKKDRKIVFITANNWWKWKLYDYKKNQNNVVFNELFVKLTQYMVVNNEKSKFRIDFENQYKANEEVIFHAFLYNDIYELINNDHISIEIIDSKSKKYEFQFSKNKKSYLVNLGVLPTGKYDFTITAKDSKVKKTGTFDILELNSEQIGPNTNHDLLYKISVLSGGDFLYSDDIQKIKKQIKTNNPSNIIYYKEEMNDFIDLPYFLLLIISIVSFEWFLRKFSGII